MLNGSFPMDGAPAAMPSLTYTPDPDTDIDPDIWRYVEQGESMP